MDRFYVSHRNLIEPVPQPRHISAPTNAPGEYFDPAEEFKIQIQDDDGRTESIVHFSAVEIECATNEHGIPVPVLQALRQLPPGVSIYVDDGGEEVNPF